MAIGGSSIPRGYQNPLIALIAGTGFFVADLNNEALAQRDSTSTTESITTCMSNGREVRRDEQEDPVVTAARRVRPAVVALVGCDGSGGTGFVVSRAHRLVATAAHVADLMFKEGPLSAFLEGGSEAHCVDRVWYHPRTRRELDFGLVANSFEPKDGALGSDSPDLALIQLSPVRGALPPGCEVQIDDDLRPVEGRAVGLLGFWGQRPKPWPYSLHDADHPATACFLSTVIHPLDHRIKRTDPAYGSFICLSAGELDYYGGSGGPIFLGDGHVVAIVTGASYWTHPDKDDCLWATPIAFLRELVAYHKLEGWIPGLAGAAPRPDWGPDPRLDKLRQAVSTVREARGHRHSGGYTATVEICDKALSIAPSYSGALLERSKAYLFFLGTHWESLTADERRRYAFGALSDSERCNQAHPSSNPVLLIHLQSIIYASCACSDQAGFASVVEWTTRTLGPDWSGEQLTGHERGFAFNLRAQAHHFVGEITLAEKDYGESIRVDPEHSRWYLNRAQFWDETSRPDLAKADRLRARELSSWSDLSRLSGVNPFEEADPSPTHPGGKAP